VIEPLQAGASGTAPRMELVSRDRRRRATRQLPLDPSRVKGPLAILLRLAASFAPTRSFRMTSHAMAPAGAGLGGSSALGMAVGAALNNWCTGGLTRQGLLKRVMNLETAELGVPTGNQDYLAALHGGLAAYRHTHDGTVREKISMPEELGERLVLAYTGQPRNSGYSNWDMFRRFIEGEGRTVHRLEEIAAIARAMRDALVKGDLDEAGRLLGEEGRLRYRLAPSVATPELRAADRVARKAGALGVKVCGAGGGGCIVALAASGRAAAVKSAWAASGHQVLEAAVGVKGLTVR
jgi:D-glycero-alpha-D-manno-heptose-7-phosphate kinase